MMNLSNNSIKLTKTTKVVIAVAVIIYLWCLGVFGVYGVTAAAVMSVATGYILKYGALLFGLFMVIFLPIRIQAALQQNKDKQESYQIKQQFDKSLAAEKLLTEVAKAREGMTKYE